MMKFGGFLARKTPLPDAPTLVAAAEAENPLELDEELFSARGTRLGAENESLRNLLIDASAKIDELDTIKNAVGKLVDPVGKALRTIEAEQAEKLALQTVLNDTRTAYGKLRNEHAELEKKATASDAECSTLRQELNVATGRLKTAETTKADLSTERNRLAAALDEFNERHDHELTSQRMRFEALQARASAGEKLLGEAREHLLARAEEMGAKDRRLNELAVERDGLQARLAELEAERITRESALQELDQASTSLSERASALARAFAAKEEALAQAEGTIGALNERLGALEQSQANEQQIAERGIEELKAALRREQMERSMVEGALGTARKDFSRVMRELMALRRQQEAAEPAPRPIAANAA
jgi:chromosome segregation ATPase